MVLEQSIQFWNSLCPKRLVAYVADLSSPPVRLLCSIVRGFQLPVRTQPSHKSEKSMSTALYTPPNYPVQAQLSSCISTSSC